MYIKKILLAIVGIGLIAAAYFAYFIYGAMLKANTAFNNEEAFVLVETGAKYEDVREQLEPLLLNIDSFDALAEQKKYVKNIKAGRFVITKGMSNNDIINTIRSKNEPIRLAFNNQESIAKLAGRIASQIEPDSLELLKAMTDAKFLRKNKFTKQTALGMYIPNSYDVYWNLSAKGFRDKMLKEYKRFWNANRMAKAKKLNLSRDEIMTLASIVHEESKQASEQPTIAGVYLNRIRIKMPLQADPTIRYAAYQLPKYKGKVIKRVLNVHKDIKSPYNTYKNRGLPPGLIAMPDVSAIDAVLNEKKHKYLFFVADAKRIGFHKFAKSLSQHNANARSYHSYLNSKSIYK